MHSLWSFVQFIYDYSDKHNQLTAIHTWYFLNNDFKNDDLSDTRTNLCNNLISALSLLLHYANSLKTYLFKFQSIFNSKIISEII